MREDARAALLRLARERATSLATLSAAIGRNPAYVHQFVHRGSPRMLPEAERRVLASMLGVPESVLGGPEGPAPSFAIPRLDVAASAGPGAFNDEAAALGIDSMHPQLARALGLKPGQAGLIRVRGDSMEPTLNDGDHLVVDESDRTPGAAGRIYVVRIDGALMVKRVAREGAGLRIASDNPEAPPVPDGDATVVGRVVWRMGAPR